MPSATAPHDNAVLLLSIPSAHTTVQHHHDGNALTLAKGPLHVLRTDAPLSAMEAGDQPPRYSEKPPPPPPRPAAGASTSCPPLEDVVTIAFLTVGDAYARPLLPITNVWKVGQRGFVFPVDDPPPPPSSSSAGGVAQGGGGGGGFHKLELGMDITPSQLESFEEVLAFTTLYARSEFKSSLALVSPSGQVVGSLADDVKFVEDSDVTQGQQLDALAAKAPVVIDYDEKASQIEGREVRRVHCAENLGDSIISSSEILSEYIVKGANLVSDGILAGTQKLTAYISPNGKPLTFLPQTRERVLRAKQLTGAAVNVTSKVVETAVNMAMMVGSTILGPPSKPGTPDKASAKTAVKTLGLKLGCAIGNVAGGVDRGARILWNASSTSTASLVGHRYGVEARNLAVDALSVAENLTLVYFDSKGVARRVIVRRAAAKLIRERLENARQQASPAGSKTTTTFAVS